MNKRRYLPWTHQAFIVSLQKIGSAGKMRNLILAALILQLVITVIEVNGFTFGDVVGFQRHWACNKGRKYMHFGIYVGNEKFPNKQDDQDIFHITGPAPNVKLSECTFGKMSELEKGEKAIIFNFLDGEGYTPGTKEDIKQRITEKLDQKNCERWNPSINNCEHLATHVRYGEKISLQICQDLKFIVNDRSKFSDETLKKMEKLFSEGGNKGCTSDIAKKE